MREKIYQEAEQIVHDDVARIPVAWPATTNFTKVYVKGLHNDWVFRDQLEYIRLEK